MVGVAEDDDAEPLVAELLRPLLGARDDRAGGVDDGRAAGLQLLHDFGADAVRRDGHGARIDGLEGGDDVDAAAAEAIDDLGVVDGGAEACDRAHFARGRLHHVDGAAHAHAEPEFLRLDHLHWGESSCGAATPAASLCSSSISAALGGRFALCMARKIDGSNAHHRRVHSQDGFDSSKYASWARHATAALQFRLK